MLSKDTRVVQDVAANMGHCERRMTPNLLSTETPEEVIQDDPNFITHRLNWRVLKFQRYNQLKQPNRRNTSTGSRFKLTKGPFDWTVLHYASGPGGGGSLVPMRHSQLVQDATGYSLLI